MIIFEFDRKKLFEVKEGSPPCVSNYVRYKGEVYIVAHIGYVYSPAADEHVAYVTLALFDVQRWFSVPSDSPEELR